MLSVFLCLLLAVTLLGCAPAPVKIIRYEPVAISPREMVAVRGGEKYLDYMDEDYEISAALHGSENVFVISLRLMNKTAQDLKASEYSIGMTDGLDYKPLQLISREVVIEYRRKISTGQDIKSGNSMLDLGLNQLSGMVRGIGRTEFSQFLLSVDWAIAHYFAFRPIYAGRTREGVLCYYADFILEYPLTLRFRLKNRPIDFRFLPPPE